MKFSLVEWLKIQNKGYLRLDYRIQLFYTNNITHN